MKTLLINKNEKFSNEILNNFCDLNYNWYTAEIGDDALSLLKYEKFDAVILQDTNSDDTHKMIKNIRKKINDPFIVLSDFNLDTDKKIEYLKEGVDDVLPYAINHNELNIRILNILRRTKGFITPVLKLEDLKLQNNIVTYKNKKIELLQRYAFFLEKTILNRGNFIPQQTLDNISLESLKVYASEINKLLRQITGCNYLHWNKSRGSYYIEKKQRNIPKSLKESKHKNKNTLNVCIFSHNFYVGLSSFGFLLSLSKQKKFLSFNEMTKLLYDDITENYQNVAARVRTLSKIVYKKTGKELFLYKFKINKETTGRKNKYIKINPESNIKFLEPTE